MIKFPLKFEVSAESDASICNFWKSQTNSFRPIECCIPAEFCGPGGGYTPEDFFALGILNCVIADFKISCEKEKETFSHVKGKVQLIMDKDSEGKIYFSEINLTIEVKGSPNKEKIEKILNETIQNCPVNKAIKTAKTLHIEIL